MQDSGDFFLNYTFRADIDYLGPVLSKVKYIISSHLYIIAWDRYSYLNVEKIES